MVEAECECSENVLEWLRMITAAYAAHDLVRLGELMTEDIVFADHRPLGTHDSEGQQAMQDLMRTTFEVLPDFEISVLVIAQDGDTYLARDTYEGHAAAGGGEALMQWWVVDTLRDGRLAREDIYATEEEARAEDARRTSSPAAAD